MESSVCDIIDSVLEILNYIFRQILNQEGKAASLLNFQFPRVKVMIQNEYEMKVVLKHLQCRSDILSVGIQANE